MPQKKKDVPVKRTNRPWKKIDDTLKVKIVLEALKESMTLNELAAKYEVHPNQIVTWKKRFLERSVDVFSTKGQEHQELEKLRHEKERLVHQIGEQAVDCQHRFTISHFHRKIIFRYAYQKIIASVQNPFFFRPQPCRSFLLLLHKFWMHTYSSSEDHIMFNPYI